MRISVVGAGPAGLLAAREASRLGASVTVYEAKRKIGGKACGGLVSRSGLDGLDIEYEDAVLNSVSSAKIFSPSGKYIELSKGKGYALVLDRDAFDNILAYGARSEGAEIILGKRVTKLNGIVIGADGANSLFAKSVGINRKLLSAFQIENKMKTDMDSVELHFGSFAPGFFAWVIPVSEGLARMGLAYDVSLANRKFGNYDPETALRFLAKRRGYPWEPVSRTGGLIPIYDGKPAVHGSLALVGDAAAQVKASTGGGIAIGGACARILGKTLGEGRELSSYESEWRAKFGRELRMHKLVYDFYRRLSDSDFEELISLVDDEIISILEKHADMEGLENAFPVFLSYLSRHPVKALKISRFLKGFGTI